MTAYTPAPTIARLLIERKGERSYARLAEDCGGVPAGRRLQQMATRPLRNFPDPDTIRAIARGLQVSVTDVVLASARSLGLDVGAGTAGLFVPDGEKLTAQGQDAVLRVAATLLAAEGNTAAAAA